MNSQPPRTYTRIAVAIIVAAVIIATTIFATSTYSNIATKTVPETATTTWTTTLTVTSSTPTSTQQTQTSTNTARCVTTNDSVGCTIFSGTLTESNCTILPLGKGLYIHVVTDSGQPLNNTQVEIYYASPICPGIQVSITGQILRTNASGWTNHSLNGAGTYKFTIQHSSQQYDFVLEKTNQTTYSTVRLPSGILTTVYVPMK